jgi:hypothetical protein
MRTASGADDSWEDKAEKEDALVQPPCCHTGPVKCYFMCYLSFLQPMRTKSGADDSWEDNAEKEDTVTAPYPLTSMYT